MKKFTILLFSLSFIWGCSDVHFSKDSAYRKKFIQRFEKRKEFAKNRSAELFKVLEQDVSREEKEALQFLYAYMPLCDLADYDGNFFLKQVQAAFEARESFEWGRKVPEEIFRHFVLPYRVNNENLDSARWVFLKELKPRLQSLSMKEAALEVNHWCHEKVNYAPTDIRTSGPLSLVRTSWGRCGEESTFTVTALRSVGIPARQVYTPRWAHSDDNHAWVEVWVDGKWSYMGACEPEPDLNMGWFTEPARRAMLVHTKVFGDYNGDEEVVTRLDNFTEINAIENYADTKKIYIRVIDEGGVPVEKANVNFGLYNYAEFYPIATKTTDAKGIVFLTTGFGDFLIWATKEGDYAGKKINVGKTDTLELVMGKGFYGEKRADVTMVPPPEKKPYAVDEAKKKENDIRLAYEDRIRMAYRNTFIDSVAAYQLAKQKQSDPQLIWNVLKKSQGNWQEIREFINNVPKKYSDYAWELLTQISDKDLRDSKVDVLSDHLLGTMKYDEEDYQSRSVFVNYVLNPRIKNEWLRAYRNYFQAEFKEKFTGNRSEKVTQIRKWVVDKIKIAEDENYYDLPITPIGVHQLKISNKESRAIFFVALCRSLGIPSRLAPSDKTPQYFNGEEWLNVYFEEQRQEQPEKGFVTFVMIDKEGLDPAYYLHFTIGKLNNGVYESLDLEWGKKLSEFPLKTELETGKYRLVTGMRGADGTVYAHLNHFEVVKNKTIYLDLKFRNPKLETKIKGHLDINLQLANELGKPIRISELEKNNSIVLLWLEPGKEPTRHLMEEFKDVQKRYEDWGGELSILQSQETADESMSREFLQNMPSNYKRYKDRNNQVLEQVKKELGIRGKIEKPLILILNPNGDIRFVSRGYKIGVHEHLLKALDKSIEFN